MSQVRRLVRYKFLQNTINLIRQFMHTLQSHYATIYSLHYSHAYIDFTNNPYLDEDTPQALLSKIKVVAATINM